MTSLNLGLTSCFDLSTWTFSFFSYFFLATWFMHGKSKHSIQNLLHL